MFQIDSDKTIYITRGDVAYFGVRAVFEGQFYTFRTGDIVRIKVCTKKDNSNVAFQKDFPVLQDTERVEILLTEKETRIGDVISKPVDYWYEIELNPYTNPQTIIGYDDDGAKIFKLFPEGKDLNNSEISEEDIPVIDSELSMTSDRPVENRVVTQALMTLEGEMKSITGNISKEMSLMESDLRKDMNDVTTEVERIAKVVSNINYEFEAEPTMTVLPLHNEAKDYMTCSEVKVLSNGINGVIDINNLLWTTSSQGVWRTLVELPEELSPLANNEEGVDDNLMLYFDDDDAEIQIGLMGNEVRVRVANATWAKQTNINCQLLYALRKTVVNEAADIRLGVNGTQYATAGEAVREQFKLRTNERPTASLILGYTNGENYVEFDSTKKTVTFPHDTVVIVNNNDGKSFKIIDNSRNNKVASWSSLSTSAICIYYNLSNEKLECKAYNFIPTADYVLLGSFRTYNGAVSINAPYKWDGKLYNMDVADTTSATSPETTLVKSVNHRGYGTAPENTLSAYKLSAEKGFKYVEADIEFTSDNIPVLLHDSTVDRTSNGSGYINNMTLAEVRALDFGSWKSSAYAGEKIPTFDEFICLCKNLGLHPYIELKASPTENQVRELVTKVRSYGMIRECTWISFNAQPLEYVRNADSKARLGFLSDYFTKTALNTALALRNNENEVFMDVKYTNILYGTQSAGYAYYDAIEYEMPVEVYTINSDSTLVSTMEQYPYITGVTSDTVHAGRTLYSKFK